MTDRRFHAANAHVAHSALAGQVNAPRLTDGARERIAVPVADLCRDPGGARDKQLLWGQAFQVLDCRGGWAFGFDPRDGYVGYIAKHAVSPGAAPTHRVCARAGHVYAEPDIKARDLYRLSARSELAVTGQADGFAALAGGGFVPLQHVEPLDTKHPDMAAAAEAFLGVPYLWGGDSSFGIDCSGLVQLALHAAGRDCPRDSDLQAGVGQPLAPDALLQRGDLVLWRGHIGMMLDATRLIHANAHHMAVAIEPLAEARARIAAREFGEITGLRRP